MPSGWSGCWARSRRSLSGWPGATRCWPAPAIRRASDRRDLGDRGLCGGFNAIDRARDAAHDPRAAGQGKSEDPVRRPQGPRSTAPRLFQPDRRHPLKDHAPAAWLSPTRDTHRRARSLEMFEDRRIRCLHVVYNQFKSAMSQIVTRQPARSRSRPPEADSRRRSRRRGLRIRAGRGRNPRRSAAAQPVGADLTARCWKAPPANRARG